MLNVSGLVKTYGKRTVLDQVSFRVADGEVVGLVGENGAGKSTLLQILATLIQPTAGKLTYEDWQYGRDTKALRRHIGFVPQDIALWQDFSVRDNMRFFEKLSWVKKSEKDLRQLCEAMELERWREPVATLSGGMKRKLNLAISLIHNPDMILLDEPTAGIDLKARTEIGEYLVGQARREGKIVIYTSHDVDEMTKVCDRVCCIGADDFYENTLRQAGQHVQRL